MERRVTKISNLRENWKYQGKRTRFEGKVMSSDTDMILKYLCGGIYVEVIGKRVLIIRRGARNGAMYDRHMGYILDIL